MPLNVTAPVKLLLLLSIVIDAPAALALKAEVPVTVNVAPVILPRVAVASRLPDTVEALKIIAFASTKVTLLPDVIVIEPKLLVAVLSVMSFNAPAASPITPVTANAPLSVIAPEAVTVKLLDTVEAPKSMAPASTNVTSLALVMLTAPTKLLVAVFNTASYDVPDDNVVVPVTAKAPESVIPPAGVVTLKLPDTVDTPMSIALESTNVTLLALVMATVDN